MDVIPKVCMLYLRYGCYTKCMDVWMSHLYTYKVYTNRWLVDVSVTSTQENMFENLVQCKM